MAAKTAAKKGKKAKSQSTGPKEPSKLGKAWSQLHAVIVEVGRNVRSPDRATRWMSILFFVSLFGMLIVLGSTFTLLSSVHRGAKKSSTGAQQDQGAEHLSQFIEKQAEEAKEKVDTLEIGNFTVELKRLPNQRDVPGVMNMAEVDIVVECDNKNTRYYLEDNLVQAKNQITGVFTAIDRDELLTRQGKRQLKKRLLDRLNTWLPKGKVENLFFSKLIIN